MTPERPGTAWWQRHLRFLDRQAALRAELAEAADEAERALVYRRLDDNYVWAGQMRSRDPEVRRWRRAVRRDAA